MPLPMGQPCLAEGWVLELWLALFQIGQVDAQRFVVSILVLQLAQFRDERLGAFVLEPVGPTLRPLGGGGAALSPQRLPGFADALCGMGKVQYTDGLGTVMVSERLQPIRTIVHGRNLLGVFEPMPMRFHQRQACKGFGAG